MTNQGTEVITGADAVCTFDVPRLEDVCILLRRRRGSVRFEDAVHDALSTVSLELADYMAEQNRAMTNFREHASLLVPNRAGLLWANQSAADVGDVEPLEALDWPSLDVEHVALELLSWNEWPFTIERERLAAETLRVARWAWKHGRDAAQRLGPVPTVSIAQPEALARQLARNAYEENFPSRRGLVPIEENGLNVGICWYDNNPWTVDGLRDVEHARVLDALRQCGWTVLATGSYPPAGEESAGYSVAHVLRPPSELACDDAVRVAGGIVNKMCLGPQNLS